MAIIRKDDVTPERPIIIVLYGTPGCGKTSLATTAESPLLIDTDRGYDRAVQRVDTITAAKWQDIECEKEAMKSYKTVIIDTAKAMIDDYLSVYVVEKNYKLATNTLKRFGQMGDEFKSFVNFLRSNGTDLIFICHDKETAEGDIIKHSPDCTGQSKDLLLRIADQVGYICKQNNKRVITFEPTDTYIGKNVARLQPMVIPDSTSKDFPDCMAAIISAVKKSIVDKSEAQRKAQEMLAELRESLAAAMTVEDIDALVQASGELPLPLKMPFFNEMKSALKSKGFVYDNTVKKFVKDGSDDKGDAA